MAELVVSNVVFVMFTLKSDGQLDVVNFVRESVGMIRMRDIIKVLYIF